MVNQFYPNENHISQVSNIFPFLLKIMLTLTKTKTKISGYNPWSITLDKEIMFDHSL